MTKTWSWKKRQREEGGITKPRQKEVKKETREAGPRGLTEQRIIL